MTDLAPVALFVYARPKHTQKTVEALIKNTLADRTNLYIFSDAPRSECDSIAVSQVREYISKIQGFKSISLIIKKQNMGLADSIIDGVSMLAHRYGKVIVLEDDLVTSPYFLHYMNEALSIYENDDRVMHIAGYIPPINTKDLPETFFLRQSSCWGWATWERAWKFFSRDGNRFIQTFRPEDIRRFNLDGAYDYWSQLLANEEGKLKTWAVYWYATVFSRSGLCLHPRESLVENIGFDGSGENCGITETTISLQKNYPFREFHIHPNKFKENEIAAQRIQEYFGGNIKISILNQIFSLLNKKL